MPIAPYVKKTKASLNLYGAVWSHGADPLSIELACITMGGKWISKTGDECGNGLEFHYRRFQEIAWPGRIWQKGPFVNHWSQKCLDVWLNYTYIGVMGCAGSGKSDTFATLAQTDWYANPRCTSTLVASTDLKSLELRIWGMIKKYHKLVKAEHKWIPGYLIEGKQMLTADHKREAEDGRDFKNGIIAVPCKRGSQFVGLGPLIGIHNKNVRLIGDEMNLMPRAMIDSTSNLSKCENFKCVGLGNPNETTNAHGFLCEPERAVGGWEGGIDQTPGTKVWKTNFPNGVCLQMPGSDSPNMKAPEGEPPPFPFLITREQMVNDAKIWGVDDWHYTMMNESRMPRGQGSRRVVTRQMCQQFGAFGQPNWRDTRRVRIAFLDAAYRGVGGDRCVFGELNFGLETEQEEPGVMRSSVMTSNIINQMPDIAKGRHILALIDQTTVPIQSGPGSDQAEDQIVKFVRKQCEARGIPASNFFYDAGMRTSLVMAFSRLWSVDVESVDCGGRPSDRHVSAEIDTLCKDYYSKFITELWYSVRLAIESGQFRGMTEEACTEFSQREWKMTSGNKIEVESKEEMKSKTGRSPDLADSIAIGVHGAIRRGFIISKLTSPEREAAKPAKDWRDEAREKARALAKSSSLSYN